MNYLDKIVAAQKKGEARGITSICSVHPLVLETVFEHGKSTESPVLIEATCNQVNQFGGYMGMKPLDFVAYVGSMMDKFEFPREQLILGGDHLGPTPWQSEPVLAAMEKSKILIKDYVLSGFTKIHLDASMKLGDDPPGPLPVEVAADRAAELAFVAESTFEQLGKNQPLRYVIGTEVPIAGGMKNEEEKLEITKIPDLTETLEKTRTAVFSRGLECAWERVIAVVVQPGVEFGDTSIHEYDRKEAADLSQFIVGRPLIYEAHSTDYQVQRALRQMVEDHFAILKVGPALTFSLREALFSLAMMENELLPADERSNLIDVLDRAMLSHPTHWQKHYHGDESSRAFARKYSFSDRSRYYWPVSDVQVAIDQLLENLSWRPLPLTLISQFSMSQYKKIRTGEIENTPLLILKDRILEIVQSYQFATRQGVTLQ